MDKNISVFRNEQGMQEALDTVRDLTRRFQSLTVRDRARSSTGTSLSTLELENMLVCAETIAVSGLARKESRGAHRGGLPRAQRRGMAQAHDGLPLAGGPGYRLRAVTITNWPPERRVY